MKKERSSNIELYRIVTMLLIVAHHYVVNSGLAAEKGVIFAHPLSKRSLFLLLFGAWGKTGINCFVLITGYFMCKSNITAKKFVKLLLEVLFYRLVINSIFWITGMERFTWKGLLYTILVVSNIGEGFTSAYLMFFLFIPFLNILIKGMDERRHLLLLALLGFMYVVLGTFNIFSVTMNYVSWFMVVYLIAAYIRLYPKDIWECRALWGCLTLFFMGLASASIVLCMKRGVETGTFIPYDYVSGPNTFYAVAVAVCSFMFFRTLNMGKNRIINTIAGSTFGVLLIHAHSNTMRRWLWQDVLDNVGHYGSRFMPLHAIGSVIGVFAVCTAIDLVRIRVLEKPFFRLWDKMEGT